MFRTDGSYLSWSAYIHETRTQFMEEVIASKMFDEKTNQDLLTSCKNGRYEIVQSDSEIIQLVKSIANLLYELENITYDLIEPYIKEREIVLVLARYALGSSRISEDLQVVSAGIQNLQMIANFIPSFNSKLAPVRKILVTYGLVDEKPIKDVDKEKPVLEEKSQEEKSAKDKLAEIRLRMKNIPNILHDPAGVFLIGLLENAEDMAAGYGECLVMRNWWTKGRLTGYGKPAMIKGVISLLFNLGKFLRALESFDPAQISAENSLIMVDIVNAVSFLMNGLIVDLAVVEDYFSLRRGSLTQRSLMRQFESVLEAKGIPRQKLLMSELAALYMHSTHIITDRLSRQNLMQKTKLLRIKEIFSGETLDISQLAEAKNLLSTFRGQDAEKLRQRIESRMADIIGLGNLKSLIKVREDRIFSALIKKQEPNAEDLSALRKFYEIEQLYARPFPSESSGQIMAFTASGDFIQVVDSVPNSAVDIRLLQEFLTEAEMGEDSLRKRIEASEEANTAWLQEAKLDKMKIPSIAWLQNDENNAPAAKQSRLLDEKPLESPSDEMIIKKIIATRMPVSTAFNSFIETCAQKLAAVMDENSVAAMEADRLASGEYEYASKDTILMRQSKILLNALMRLARVTALPDELYALYKCPGVFGVSGMISAFWHTTEMNSYLDELWDEVDRFHCVIQGVLRDTYGLIPPSTHAFIANIASQVRTSSAGAISQIHSGLPNKQDQPIVDEKYEIEEKSLNGDTVNVRSQSITMIMKWMNDIKEEEVGPAGVSLFQILSLLMQRSMALSQYDIIALIDLYKTYMQDLGKFLQLLQPLMVNILAREIYLPRLAGAAISAETERLFQSWFIFYESWRGSYNPEKSAYPWVNEVFDVIASDVSHLRQQCEHTIKDLKWADTFLAATPPSFNNVWGVFRLSRILDATSHPDLRGCLQAAQKAVHARTGLNRLDREMSEVRAMLRVYQHKAAKLAYQADENNAIVIEIAIDECNAVIEALQEKLRQYSEIRQKIETALAEERACSWNGESLTDRFLDMEVSVVSVDDCVRARTCLSGKIELYDHYLARIQTISCHGRLKGLINIISHMDDIKHLATTENEWVSPNMRQFMSVYFTRRADEYHALRRHIKNISEILSLSPEKIAESNQAIKAMLEYLQSLQMGNTAGACNLGNAVITFKLILNSTEPNSTSAEFNAVFSLVWETLDDVCRILGKQYMSVMPPYFTIPFPINEGLVRPEAQIALIRLIVHMSEDRDIIKYYNRIPGFNSPDGGEEADHALLHKLNEKSKEMIGIITSKDSVHNLINQQTSLYLGRVSSRSRLSSGNGGFFGNSVEGGAKDQFTLTKTVLKKS